MFTFFVVLAVVGLIGLIISLIMLIDEHEPFALWVTLVCVCGLMWFGGTICAGAFTEKGETSPNLITQVEQVEGKNEQYNYCPYCGKEIK